MARESRAEIERDEGENGADSRGGFSRFFSQFACAKERAQRQRVRALDSPHTSAQDSVRESTVNRANARRIRAGLERESVAERGAIWAKDRARFCAGIRVRIHARFCTILELEERGFSKRAVLEDSTDMADKGRESGRAARTGSVRAEGAQGVRPCARNERASIDRAGAEKGCRSGERLQEGFAGERAQESAVHVRCKACEQRLRASRVLLYAARARESCEARSWVTDERLRVRADGPAPSPGRDCRPGGVRTCCSLEDDAYVQLPDAPTLRNLSPAR